MMADAMTQTSETLELARSVRELGFFARLAGDGMGMASVGAIRASGGDVLSFIHSQVTNEVEGLGSGEGNYSARVTLQGQLVELFSVHRLDVDGRPEIWLVLERERVAPLVAELETVLFADDVRLVDISDAYRWSAVQGPGSAAVLDVVISMFAV